MANRLSQEKANAIASEYCTNGYDKVKALLAVGYAHSYAHGKGLKRYDNDLVKQAIARIQACSKANTDYTMTQYHADLDRIISKSEGDKVYSVAMTGTIAKGRTQGFDRDNDMTTDQQQELDQAQEQEAREIAKLRLVRGA